MIRLILMFCDVQHLGLDRVWRAGWRHTAEAGAQRASALPLQDAASLMKNVMGFFVSLSVLLGAGRLRHPDPLGCTAVTRCLSVVFAVWVHHRGLGVRATRCSMSSSCASSMSSYMLLIAIRNGSRGS
jgi:hypothetical protein